MYQKLNKVHISKIPLWPFSYLYPFPLLISPFNTLTAKPNQNNFPSKRTMIKDFSSALSCRNTQFPALPSNYGENIAPSPQARKVGHRERIDRCARLNSFTVSGKHNEKMCCTILLYVPEKIREKRLA